MPNYSMRYEPAEIQRPEKGIPSDKAFADMLADQLGLNSRPKSIVLIDELNEGAQLFSTAHNFSVKGDRALSAATLSEEEVNRALTSSYFALKDAREFLEVGQAVDAFNELSEAYTQIEYLVSHNIDSQFQPFLRFHKRELKKVVSAFYPEGGCQKNPSCGLW